MKVGCVVLASGFGRRFGGNKLLAEVEGVPLYQRTLRALPRWRLERVAVVSQYPEVLAEAGRRGDLAVENRQADEGISASIRLGLAEMDDMDGVLFCVCDQPFLNTNSIIELLNSFEERKNGIFALSWQGERGNPVVFSKDYFGELMALSGDVGGGTVIRNHEKNLHLVEVEDGVELWDVDVSLAND